jgi:protein ImuA
MAAPAAQQSLVAALRRQVERLEGHHALADEAVVSCGSPPLDRMLPGGGLRWGTLIEYLAPAAACGAAGLAMAAAREACRAGRTLVVVDRRCTFYPPAAAAWGIDLSRLLILQPVSSAEELWALDQALRCPGVGAVFYACGPLDAREFRRLQLAAETGGTLGLLLRPSRLRGQPTWSEVQWQIQPCGLEQSKVQGPRSKVRKLEAAAWRLSVELVHCRGGPAGQAAVVELDETTGIWREARDDSQARLMYPSAELAYPASARRA